MIMRYCQNCGKETGHKRALGLGTVLAIILTLGFWLLVLPFYPKRCIACGNAKSTANYTHNRMPSPIKSGLYNNVTNRRTLYLFIAVTFVIFVLANIFNKPSKKSPQVETYAPLIGKSDKSSPSISDQAKSADSEERKMTPADHLEAAKKALQEDDTITARTQLSFIPEGSKEYFEAQMVKKSYAEACYKKLKEERIQYARTLENEFLDKGYDITVKVEGKEASILKIKWILTSRVLVHKLSKDHNLIKKWEEMGFTKVIFTDGYHSTWYMKLTPINLIPKL